MFWRAFVRWRNRIINKGVDKDYVVRNMTPCQLLKSSGTDVFYVEVWGSRRLQDIVILYPSTWSHISLQHQQWSSEQYRSSSKLITIDENGMKYLPSGLNKCPRLWMYLTELEQNTVLQPLLYLNTTELQYSLCTVLLAELKAKFITELTAVRNFTVTNDTEFKGKQHNMLLCNYV